MSDRCIYYRRHLPHWFPETAVYHIVFRLKGSLPAEAVRRHREELEQLSLELKSPEDRSESEVKHFRIRKAMIEKMEPLLDGAPWGPTWLRRPAIATIVQDALLHFEGKRYELLAHCIMPNHVHVVCICSLSGIMTHEKAQSILESLPARNSRQELLLGNLGDDVAGTGVPSNLVSDLFGSIKKYTARRANPLLGRSGAFWQDESYDHVIRDSPELERTISYVINNPVKAKLVTSWDLWPWTYLKPDIGYALA